MSDLSPEDRRQIDDALAAAGAEIGEDTIVVRSDIWPRGGDVYDWELRVADHTVTGRAASVNDCHAAMNERLADWYPEEMAEAGTPFLVARLLNDA